MGSRPTSHQPTVNSPTMKEVCIHLPSLQPGDTLELELKLNGKKRLVNYRVETYFWREDTRTTGDKITRLRHFVENYDDEWELVQIGSPGDDRVAVMFKQRAEPTPAEVLVE